MPGSRHSGRQPGPLANLPRPLDERDGSRRRRRVRRAASSGRRGRRHRGHRGDAGEPAARSCRRGPGGGRDTRSGRCPRDGHALAQRPIADRSDGEPDAERVGDPVAPADARAARDARGLPLAVAARSAHAAVRAVAVGIAPRRRQGVPRRRRPRDVLWRPHQGRPRRHGAGGEPSVRHRDRVGRQPQALLRATRPQAPVGNPADHGRHRRRQRVSQHLRALQQSRREEGSDGQGRSAPGLRRDDRACFRLPPPLRAVQPVGDNDLRDRARRREADEGPGGPDRADRPVARDPAARRRARSRAPQRRPSASRGPGSAPPCCALPAIRPGVGSAGRPASTPGSTRGPPTATSDARRDPPVPADGRWRSRRRAGHRRPPGRSRSDRGRARRVPRRRLVGGAPASYSARTSASERQVGWRRRIACHASASGCRTRPSPGSGSAASPSTTSRPRAQRAAWWSSAYSSRSAYAANRSAGEPSPKIARIDGPKTSARSRSMARTVRWK